MRRLDHLLWAVPDLDAAITDAARRFGVRPAPGGSHPGRGTRNALLALGASRYLEIIGPDPAQPEPPGGRAFGIARLTAPRLVTWVATSEDLERDVERARLAGEDLGDVEEGARRRADGVELRWRMAGARTPRMGGVIPFLIDWGATPHPAATAPAGCRLESLRAEHPDSERARAVLAELGLDLLVAPGPEPRLFATLATPAGTVEL